MALDAVVGPDRLNFSAFVPVPESPAGMTRRRWVGSELIVDHSALARNVARVREWIGRRFFWAVVKADGYGLGAIEVSRTVLAHGADGLAVARIEEYAQLRAAGIDAPVLLLGPLPDEVPSDPRLHLTISAACETEPAPPPGHPLHLKIDTGMGRLGFATDDPRLDEIVARCGDALSGIWTHYARAEELDGQAVREQHARFTEVLDRLGVEGRQIHAANSGGLAFLTEREDAVRVGLFLYGVAPWDGPGPLRPEPVVAWRAPLLDVRARRAGEPVSYGSEWQFATDGWSGVIPVGYADGLCAAHTDALVVWIDGRRFPIRGRVTMDLSVVEVDGPAREGADAWLLGPVGNPPEAIGVHELARATARIPWEVLTAIGGRVRRRHIRSDHS